MVLTLRVDVADPSTEGILFSPAAGNAHARAFGAQRCDGELGEKRAASLVSGVFVSLVTALFSNQLLVPSRSVV